MPVLPGVSRYTDEELLTRRCFPCRVCGADVEVDRLMRMWVLRWRYELWWREGDPDRELMHLTSLQTYTRASILDELRTLPGIICRYESHRASVIYPRSCERCGSAFIARRASGRFCSGRCRVAAHRSQEP